MEIEGKELVYQFFVLIKFGKLCWVGWEVLSVLLIGDVSELFACHFKGEHFHLFQ